MSKVDQIATKAMRYGGQALKPGDPFQASRRDARVLEAIGKSKPVSAASPINDEDTGAAPSPPKDVADIDALRSAYQTAAGRDPDGRWGEGKLREKIKEAESAAGGAYQRRDMRAED